MPKLFQASAPVLIAAGVLFLVIAIRTYQVSGLANVIGLVIFLALGLLFVWRGVRRLIFNAHLGGDGLSTLPQVMEDHPPQDIHERRVGILRRRAHSCLFIWLPLLFASFMAFDAPNAQNRIGPWLSFAFILLMPVLIFVMPKLAKRALANGRTKLAYVFALAPILPFAVLLAWLFVTYAILVLFTVL